MKEIVQRGSLQRCIRAQCRTHTSINNSRSVTKFNTGKKRAGITNLTKKKEKEGGRARASFPTESCVRAPPFLLIVAILGNGSFLEVPELDVAVVPSSSVRARLCCNLILERADHVDVELGFKLELAARDFQDHGTLQCRWRWRWRLLSRTGS